MKFHITICDLINNLRIFDNDLDLIVSFLGCLVENSPALRAVRSLPRRELLLDPFDEARLVKQVVAVRLNYHGIVIVFVKAYHALFFVLLVVRQVRILALDKVLEFYWLFLGPQDAGHLPLDANLRLHLAPLLGLLPANVNVLLIRGHSGWHFSYLGFRRLLRNRIGCVDLRSMIISWVLMIWNLLWRLIWHECPLWVHESEPVHCLQSPSHLLILVELLIHLSVLINLLLLIWQLELILIDSILLNVLSVHDEKALGIRGRVSHGPSSDSSSMLIIANNNCPVLGKHANIVEVHIVVNAIVVWLRAIRSYLTILLSQLCNPHSTFGARHKAGNDSAKDKKRYENHEPNFYFYGNFTICSANEVKFGVLNLNGKVVAFGELEIGCTGGLWLA